MCSEQYCYFLQFLNFVFSWHVAQALCEWFWNGSCCPCYNRYQFCFHIPHEPNFCYVVFYITKSSRLLSLSHFGPQELQHLLTPMFLVYYDGLAFIIIIIIISFMQGVYTYIPDTSYVPREYSVAAILLLLFMVLISFVSVLNLLYFYISTFRSMCAVPNMAVFCSSLTSCFPAMLLTYFLNDYETVPAQEYYYYYYY